MKRVLQSIIYLPSSVFKPIRGILLTTIFLFAFQQGEPGKSYAAAIPGSQSTKIIRQKSENSFPLPVARRRPGSADSLPKVRQVDLSTIDPDLFAKEEWFVPYYLKHFSQVANSVVESGPNRGFINISVWRTPDVNHPYNARIMESILSLAWFYTQNKPWNPYYSDLALRARLEAALSFWCSIQNEKGQFSEYASDRYSLAPTAFAAKFIGKAMYILKDGPEIDPKLRERMKGSLRKVLHYSFTSESSWEHGRNYTNQFANLWGGALMYLELWPDPEIEQLFRERLQQSMKEFQSRCGYFYEKNGPDWGYNLSTHHSDLHVAWHFAKDTDLETYFVEKTKDWYDWFSYNAVKEPGKEVYFLNKEVETRQNHWVHKVDVLEDPAHSRWTPQAEMIPVAMAFQPDDRQYKAMVEVKYRTMRDKYPEVADLNIGEFWAFSPYTFLHNDLVMWFPSEEQKQQAIAGLPCLRNEEFAQVRVDSRNQTNYTFVKKAPYYAIFNGGKIINEVQRFGLGLLWHPTLGTVLQSQSRSNDAVWGTRSGRIVYEAADVDVKISSVGKEFDLHEGIHSLDHHQLKISYQLGGSGSKTLSFDQEKLKVSISHEGNFREAFPLMIGEDATVTYNDNKITIRNEEGEMNVLFRTPVKIKRSANIVSIEGKTCHVFEVKAKDELEYEFIFKE